MAATRTGAAPVLVQVSRSPLARLGRFLSSSRSRPRLARLVEWHDRTLRTLFREHRGDEVDHAGDGFFVAFQDPAAALACAVAIQRALAEHRRHHGFAPPVRIGVHTADTIPAGGGFRGKGVHVAARVGAVAEGNEILASRETADAARVSFTNPRIVELKGISEPVEIVCVDWT